jgi:hypothetical protein
MNIRVNFSGTEHRDAFADRFKLDIPAGVDHLDVPWHLLNHVKNDPNASDFSALDTATEHEFIVKGDLNTISLHATVKQDLGMGFYLVSTTDGTTLSKNVETIDINSQPMNFLDVSNITSMNGTPSSLDPLSSEGQWARIRVASRYRPLQTSFSVHEVNYKSTPEFYVMDTGINFNHVEFDNPDLVKVNFYALPVFNGDFSDDVGHGTSVTSMAVGKNIGVASKAKVMNVKIGSSTHNATLIEVGMAIDAILTEISANPNVSRVINMSWGIPRSGWLDAKVQSLLDAGATVICAAGNSGISVEDISPAGMDNVITVGAIDRYDIPAGFNNISPSDSGLVTSAGLSLDIFAPGDEVLVAKGITNNEYFVASGTSFACPLVAGVALEVCALNETPCFYDFIKKTIIDTATEHALLFEDDKFSENQNRLVYLYTSDPLAMYKNSDMVSYLGIHTSDPTSTIIADLNSALDIAHFKTIYPDDTVVYSIEWVDPAQEPVYGSFLAVDPVTGVVTISKPTVALPEETKLVMVKFTGVATTSRVKIKTNTLFFFYNNPAYQDTLESDITLALTDINSISFFASWAGPLK